jgi:hypothetical protein
MKKVAIVFGVVAVLLFADGLYMVLANYHPGDANTFFGNQNWNMSDGEVTLISSGFLFLAAVIMWVIAVRRQARSAAGATRATGTDTAKTEQSGRRTASQA